MTISQRTLMPAPPMPWIARPAIMAVMLLALLCVSEDFEVYGRESCYLPATDTASKHEGQAGDDQRPAAAKYVRKLAIHWHERSPALSIRHASRQKCHVSRA